MEDEDSERKVMDMWSILGEQDIKEQPFENTLKDSIDSPCADSVEEEKQLLQYNSIGTKDSPSKNSSPGSKIIFKGFKKRILAQAQETETVSTKVSSQDQQLPQTNISPKAKEKRAEAKRGKITEYAQYLGLQPSSKSKCTKCHTSSNFCSTGKQNSCSCNSNMTPMPSTSEPSPVSNASNFKITRKVYLCAACGTYFENWNLFLHMRDIHKRHICLFCLGMFGQAERLSHHLVKKHSVPEMAFTSVEEFYSVFKGSCYLVCCTCEKVFSETDNFYNHFCSPPSKQDVTASICTLCRQTGTHASTCSLAIETSKEVRSSLPAASTGNTMPSHILDRTANTGGKIPGRKSIKNNRAKFAEDGMSNSLSQKLAHVKKTSSKSISSQQTEAQHTKIEHPQNDIISNSIRDTVSETIMEVSRYVEDPTEESEDKVEPGGCPEPPLDTRLPVEDSQSKEPYDSVTETIMEVSRCKNEEEIMESTMQNENSGSTESLDSSEKAESDSETIWKDTQSIDTSREIDDRPEAPSPVNENLDEDTSDHKSEKLSESKPDEEPQSPCTPAQSPVSRSLFSPQHESHASNLPPSEEHTEIKEEEQNIDAPSESQTSVSFNAVPSSDRSLVIKICTNRNSQFSVTSATASDNAENHDASRESEETVNVDESPSEKVFNTSEREKENGGSYIANEGDSDSDSYKLAVVDSSNQEAPEEEAEDIKPSVENAMESEEVTIGNVSYNEENGNEKSFDLAVDEKYEVEEKAEDTTEQEDKKPNVETELQPSDGIVLAGEDVPSVDLNVEGTLDSIEIEELLKRCIETASPFCVYCNHARHIAVNGKQLGLHILAEHKFQPQHPAIIIEAEQFITRVKKSLDEVESRFFNLDSYTSTNGTYNIPNVRMYECFHCRFYSAVHKELYLHNRKMHQKTILICIMCKSTFYSYSELLCHLCPGTYSPNINVRYRCCLCSVTNLPSAFRLMVHLRKRHHACDVCLEPTGNQQRLSNHVWKHKLHHLCYRCGIAYRNKPDITKHLFWKHGTESVLCKKCLQKKWPHIYHFCIPPTAFVCEECGSNFSRAVALKVHKRLHSGDCPYACSECSERFISKKLLAKHEDTHREQPAVDVTMIDATSQPIVVDEENPEKQKTTTIDNNTTIAEPLKDTKETVKKVVDVYDLPPLNLSSESDTDSEDEKGETKESGNTEKEKIDETNVPAPTEVPKPESPPVPVTENTTEVEENEEEKKQEAEIMDGIWDNFKTYTASLEKKESANILPIKEPEQVSVVEPEPEPETDVAFLRSIVLADHDYCVVYSDKDKNENEGTKEEEGEEEAPREANYSVDQENPNKSPSTNTFQNESDPSKKKVKSPKKKKQSASTSSSDSSSDSDSSSCSCGTNCSCSSSSSGSSSSSSSSSDSDSSGSESSPKKQSSRKERKKEKEISQERTMEPIDPENKEICVEVENGAPPIPVETIYPQKPLLRESDLETDETETDEDFYDEHPQQLANKLLAEKRNQLLLLAAVAPASVDSSSVSLNNGIAETDTAVASPDTIPSHVNISDEQPQQKRKVKTKKRKKGERNKQRNTTPTVESIKLNIPKAFYQKSPGFSASSPTLITLQPSRSSTPNIIPNDIHVMTSNTVIAPQTPVINQNVGEAASGQENKRFSKRKRVPKRFYGDSSDEETEKPPAMKWRKVEPSAYVGTTPTIKTIPPRVSFGGKTMTYRPPPVEACVENIHVTAAASATESEEAAESSSDSSDSEPEVVQPQVHPPQTNPPVPEKTVNLYCYCQCPYDEVSEMIACDGEDCRIEWFHFECVGIMVPPKGKWYCPDCRKKHDIVQNSEDYFD